ncbi:hypothetical protein [Moraxella lacunata]
MSPPQANSSEQSILMPMSLGNLALMVVMTNSLCNNMMTFIIE